MAYSIDYIYRVIDKFSPALKAISGTAKNFNTQFSGISGALGKLQGKLQGAANSVSGLQSNLAATGAQQYFKQTFNDAIEFNTAMNEMDSVVKDITRGDASFTLMKKQAMEWGASTKFSAIEVAQAMAEFGRKGLQSQQIMEVMSGTLDFAAAGNISLAQSADFTTGIINQFGLGLSDSTRVADLLARAAAGSSTSVLDMARSMKNTGLQARISGLSIEDTSLALMMLANQSQIGSRAGTFMMNALTELSKLAPKTEAGFVKMGINIDKFRDKNTGAVTDFWGLIDAMKASGVSSKDLADMFGRQSTKAIAVLTSTTAAQREALMKSRDDVTMTAKSQAEALLGGPVGALVRLESAQKNFNIAIGEINAEIMSPWIERFTNFLTELQFNYPWILKFIAGWAMFFAGLAVILVPLGMVINSIIAIVNVVRIFAVALKFLTVIQWLFNASLWANPITWIILGIVALIAVIVLLVIHWDKVKAAFIKAWNWIKEGILWIWNWLLKLLDNPFFALIGIVFLPFLTIPILIVKNWSVIKEFFLNLWAGITNVFFTSIESIKNFVTGLWDTFMVLLDNPFFTLAATLLAPWLTIPALIVKNWSVVKDMFAGIGEKIASVGAFFGIGEKAKMQTESAKTSPVPVQPRQDVNVNANASISVYKEQGVGVKPFEKRGNLGYQMGEVYQ